MGDRYNKGSRNKLDSRLINARDIPEEPGLVDNSWMFIPGARSVESVGANKLVPSGSTAIKDIVGSEKMNRLVGSKLADELARKKYAKSLGKRYDIKGELKPGDSPVVDFIMRGSSMANNPKAMFAFGLSGGSQAVIDSFLEEE